MAQVSYGTITITDTNDIERIYMEYAQSSSNSTAPTTGWSENIPAWEQEKYIWQRTVVKKEGVALSSDSYGDPVCLTGSTGSTGATGRGVSSIVTTYCNYGTGTPAASYSGWSTTVPTYDSTKPNYWVKTVITYTTGTPATETKIYQDNGITSATATAASAKTQAAAAEDKADSAVSTANTANTNATNALNIATGINQHFWTIATDYATGVPAGSYITDTAIDTFKSNKTGGNLLTRSDGIWIRNGVNTLASLTGTALTFYNPSTNAAQLVIGANGTLQSGNYSRGSNSKFSDSGTKIDLTYGDIITKYFRLSQGVESLSAGAYIYGTIEAIDGKIGSNTTNYWEIGNYTDYLLQPSAKLIGHGSSFIQLGNSGTWRLATNRIHTGWYESGDSYLHFPIFTNGTINRRWDYGIHVPTSKDDKFLYIRNASSTTDLSNLISDLEDTQNPKVWEYQFYIDGSGNVHAPGFYIGDSTTPIGGGAGTVAERLTQGYGSATQPVYFNSNGVPTNTTYQLNAAGAKGVDTSISAASTSTNLPTSQAVAAFVEGKGYSTTDNKVQTSQANTTKIYLAGTSTAGTSTGTLNFDSNVYLTTTTGTLHATTFDGTSFTGTAAKATSDSDGNKISTTYLKLSGGNVTGAVTFGSSVSADELTVGDLVVNGNASFTNNAQFNTINGVAVGSNPKFTDNNTTYTFANGTNGFTVTPLGGTAQTVTVTPSIANNVTGSGTNGYLAKFTGANTIGNGPALGSDTTKFLNNKGEWAVPAGTYTYTLPLAANGTRGGVQIGYTTSGKNYAVQLSSEKMYVNVPWENTTYSAGTGLSLSGTTFNHSNSVTAGTAGTSSATSSSNRTIAIPYVTYDAQGHITGSGTHTHTLDSFPEAYLAWGGRNITGDITPVGTSISMEHSANRIAYLNPAAIQIEYTTNGGSTWTDSGYTNDEKMWLCTGDQGIAIGQSRAGYSASTALTTNHWTRITLTGQNGTTQYVYTNPRKLLINMSTALGVNCLIEYKTGVSGAAWQTFGTYAVSGWSGWNDIPLILSTFGGGTTQTSNNWYLRFTFKISSTRTDNYKGMALVYGLRLFGTNNWGSASSNNGKGPISSTGHLYSYDASANATFPAKVTANGGFSGNLTGIATGNVTSVQYDGTNKKITYTKNGSNTDIVTIATIKTDLGSMPASDVYSWAKASTKPSYSYNEIGSAPDAIVNATVNDDGVIVLTKNSGGTIPLSTEIAVVESQGANKLVEAGSTTGISVGSAAEPVYFSAGVPVKGNAIPKLNNTTTGGVFYAPTAIGTAKQILVSSGNAAPTWQTVATGGTNGTIKIGSDEYGVKGLAAAAYKALADSSSASAIGTGTNVTTERDVYYGLPTINNAHNYTSSTTIYAPTSGGTSTQVLIGNGTTSAPVWTSISSLVPSSATNATNDSDGNPINTTYIKKSIGTAAGDIIYWSAASTPTRLAKGSNGQVLKLANGVPTWGTDNNDNTWRGIQVDGTDILGTGTNTNKLNLKAGTNISLSNSSGSVTITATDVKVTQTNTTGNADYRLLFSENANDTTSTETARKSTYLKFNPSSGLLKTYGISSTSGSTPVIYSDVSSAEIKEADSSLTTSSSDSDWLKALLIALCNKYPGKTGYIFKGTMSPNSVGWYEVHIYSTSAKDSTTGLPQYSFGRFLKYINNYSLFGTASYSYSYRTVDTNTWNPLTTSQAGYVSTAPNDTAKFLRGDATWAQVSSANLSDIRLTWSSSVSTTDWILAHDTAATGTPLFRAMSPANLKTTMSLNNVENKSSATIRGELTSSNVTTALGYTPVNKAGDTMTGTLTVNVTSGAGNYNEGVRINKANNNYSTLTLGGASGSTSGTGDGIWWIGTNQVNYPYRLMIAHNGSGATGTYFYVPNSSTVTPLLRLGTSGTITSGNMDAVNGGTVYTAISNLSGSYVSLTGNEGILGTKVFGSGTSYGSVTSKTSYTEKANINYNATLDALVFSFA